MKKVARKKMTPRSPPQMDRVIARPRGVSAIEPSVAVALTLALEVVVVVVRAPPTVEVGLKIRTAIMVGEREGSGGVGCGRRVYPWW